MIRELITYLVTPCPRYARSMGCLYQAIALRGRYERRRMSWQPHLDRTRSFVARAAVKCSRRGKVVVLGSGLLLDVPLDRLSDLFEEVILADVIHLPEVRRRIGRYRNVRLVQCDVTGLAEKLYGGIVLGSRDLPAGVPFFPEVDQNAGLVISLNILSQLAAIPLDYVTKNVSGLDEALLDKWCDRIREAHYQALKALHCDVCLVADYEFARKDSDGNMVECGSTVGVLRLPEPDESWIWQIAPLGEETKYLFKELRVGAWHLKRIE